MNDMVDTAHTGDILVIHMMLKPICTKFYAI